MHAGKKTDFRDFFRETLQASLEVSSRSRSLSARQTSVSAEHAQEENQISSSSSSSCVSCVRLQKAVMHLQGELFRLTGPQKDLGLQAAQIEEEVPKWAEPLEGDLDQEDQLSPSCSVACGTHQAKKIRPTPRFRKSWLRMFWFLRYSPSLNQMWCHVCRLHADKTHRDKGLIKGSRMFKLYNIKSHSASSYHKYNMERHLLQVCSLKF
uniref:uncharacterized protein n=1 Tax=Semicossyphus pulcher TaxID=241346 RepID=UPI0037E938C2